MDEDLDEFLQQEQVYYHWRCLTPQAAWLQYQRKTGTSGAARVVRSRQTIQSSLPEDQKNQAQPSISAPAQSPPPEPKPTEKPPTPFALVGEIKEKTFEEDTERTGVVSTNTYL